MCLVPAPPHKSTWAKSAVSSWHLALNGFNEWNAGPASARRAVAPFNSVGVPGSDAHQPRLKWARMAEMVAVVASALPPP